MPVILDQKSYARWLGEWPVTDNELRKMLRPYPAKEMKATKIGPQIGNVRNDDAALVEPVA